MPTPVPRLDRYDCALGNKHSHRYNQRGLDYLIEDQAFLPSYYWTPPPALLTPSLRQQVVSLSQSFCVSLVELIIVGRGEGGN